MKRPGVQVDEKDAVGGGRVSWEKAACLRCRGAGEMEGVSPKEVSKKRGFPLTSDGNYADRH